ncbi:MAG TPA: amidohydrolase family protein [Kofleriaceae bacterium]|nr:amidohydrolase family protein [Kofleriaceae bacterium]
MHRVVACLLLAACGGTVAVVKTKPADEPKLDITAPWIDPEAFWIRGTPTKTRPLTDALTDPNAKTIAIKNATILTATGQKIDSGTIVMEHGSITYVGADKTPPQGATVIDGKGKFVSPGIIDAHSHMGVYPAPNGKAHNDGNEAVGPITAHARAEYGYWPQDPQLARALAGGVTTALILPGSANLIGGRGFTVSLRPGARTAAEAAFPGAPPTVKMACGENPKRVYGEKGGPQTRMAEYAAFRAAFAEAAAYQAKKAAYENAWALWQMKKKRAEQIEAKRKDNKKVPGENAPEPVPVDLRYETLAGVLRGDVLVQIHCYRADDMANLIQVADEMGFRIRSFHHALEAYKIRDLLAQKNIAVNTWADWWGFKLEAYDGIPENAALLTQMGVRTTIHSDSAIGGQRLNQEAAKAQAAGNRAGIKIDDDTALRWVTVNPARVLGIDGVTGTLQEGKRADVVMWSASPLSVYARAELVIVGGQIAYDKGKGLRASDFELDDGRTP